MPHTSQHRASSEVRRYPRYRASANLAVATPADGHGQVGQARSALPATILVPVLPNPLDPPTTLLIRTPRGPCGHETGSWACRSRNGRVGNPESASQLARLQSVKLWCPTHDECARDLHACHGAMRTGGHRQHRPNIRSGLTESRRIRREAPPGAETRPKYRSVGVALAGAAGTGGACSGGTFSPGPFLGRRCEGDPSFPRSGDSRQRSCPAGTRRSGCFVASTARRREFAEPSNRRRSDRQPRGDR